MAKKKPCAVQNTQIVVRGHKSVLVSKPGAAIRTERVLLSETERKGLSAGVDWLPQPMKRPATG